MSIADLSIIIKNQKQPKCSSTKRISKLWYIHITEYCSTIKMNQLLIYAMTWMNLEHTLLSERNQMQKDWWDILSESIHTTLLKRQKYRDRKQINVCIRVGVWLKSGSTREYFFFLGGGEVSRTELLCILIVDLVNITMQLSKVLELRTQKRVNSIIRKWKYKTKKYFPNWLFFTKTFANYCYGIFIVSLILPSATIPFWILYTGWKRHTCCLWL